jgi:CubicO group peptidase (beta-lactamase class C family)
MIEKLSGMKYGEYLSEKIFKPLGLTNTYYDPYDGEFDIIKNYANQYYRLWNAQTGEQLGIVSCGPYLPTSGAPNGAGGMLSTVSDVVTWYLDLFGNNGRRSKLLSEQSILQIVKPWTFIPQDNVYFGQGILVIYDQFNSNGTLIPVDPSQFGFFSNTCKLLWWYHLCEYLY